MPDFDKYFISIEKRTVKISLPPDKEALKAAFWAGFEYNNELQQLKKDSGADNTNLTNFNDLFGGIFGGKK